MAVGDIGRAPQAIVPPPVGRETILRTIGEHLVNGQIPQVTGVTGSGKSTVLRTFAARSTRPTLEISGVRGLERRPFGALDVLAGNPAAEVGDRLQWLKSRAEGTVVIVDELQWLDGASLDLLFEIAASTPLVTAGRNPTSRPGPRVRHLPLMPLGPDDSQLVVRSLAPRLEDDEVAGLVRTCVGHPGLLCALAGAGDGELQALTVSILADCDPLERTALVMLAVAKQPLALEALGVEEDQVEGNPLLRTAGAGVVELRHPLLAMMVAKVAGTRAMDDAHRRLPAVAAASSSRIERSLPLPDPSDPGPEARPVIRLPKTPIEQAAELEQRLRSGGTDASVPAVLVATAWLDARRPVQAQALVDEFSGRFTEAEAAWILAGSAWLQGQIELVDQLVEQGLRSAGHEDWILGELEQLAARVDLEVRYDALAAIVHADRSVAHLERIGRSTAGPLATRCRAEMLAGRDGSAMALSEAVEAAESAGDTDGAIHLIRAQFASLAFFGHPTEAEAALSLLEQLAVRHQRHGDLVSAKAIRAGLALFLHGDAVRADRLCRELEGEPLSHRAGSYLIAVRGIALADTGRLRMAERLLHSELKRATSPATRAAVHAALAEIHLAGANYRLAAEHAAIAIADGPPVAPVIINAFAAQAWARLGLGEPVVAPAGEAPYPAVAGATLEIRAIASWTTGDAASASTGFTRAASVWRPYNRRGELRCRWAAALTLAEAGQEMDAVDALLLLDEDRALPTWMGDVVRSSLRRLGVARRLAAEAGASTITRRERQVLELAGHGYSARRIAEQFRLSESTVNSIVRSASLRLGARSRLHASAINAGRIDLPTQVVMCGPEHIVPCRARLTALGVRPGDLVTGVNVSVRVGTVGDTDRLLGVLAALGEGVHCIIGADDRWALDVADAIHRLRLGVVHLIDEPEADPDLMAGFTLSREEQTVLASMASGLTLAEAADAIGFSRRTAARRLAGAKQRLGADSAAQAIERWAEFTR